MVRLYYMFFYIVDRIFHEEKRKRLLCRRHKKHNRGEYNISVLYLFVKWIGDKLLRVCQCRAIKATLYIYNPCVRARALLYALKVKPLCRARNVMAAGESKVKEI